MFDFREMEKIVDQVRKRMGSIVGQMFWTRKEVEAFQLERLQRAVAFAREQSPFWRKRFELAQFPKEVSQLTFEKFNELPTLTKKEAMANREQIQCVDVNGRESDFWQFSTGGSSGVRGKSALVRCFVLFEYFVGTFLWDREMVINSGCLTYRSLALQEQELGWPGPVRIAVVNASDDPMTSKHASTLLFGTVAGAFPVSVELETRFIRASIPLQQIKQSLEEFQPTHLVSFGSIFHELAVSAEAGQFDIGNSLRYVMTNSEPLSEESRDIAKKLWNVHVHNSLGCVEAAVHTMGDAALGTEMLCQEDYIIIQSTEEKQFHGTFEGILVTPLQTVESPFPLFRYLVEDVVEMELPADPFPAFRRIKSVVGRQRQAFFYKLPDSEELARVEPIAFSHVLVQEPNLLEYQIKQTDDGADIAVVATNEEEKLDVDSVSKGLGHYFSEVGFHNANINVHQVGTCDTTR